MENNLLTRWIQLIYQIKCLSFLHLLMLLTSKLFIGLSIGLMFSDFAFPYSYPILVIGIFIFLPAILKLFKKEKIAEEKLKKQLKKKRK